MELEGKLLGNRYEILEKIGNGGMATVYKAKCHVLNRFVAVKILRDEFTTDAEFVRRFEIEAQAAASISHPNIVSVYDVGKDGSLYYIVMELVQGKTLKEIIVGEGGPLPWKWSVNIAIQIASALEVAHKNNIVHRDIKPHNIIITEDGVAKVTDFGIAKAVSNSTITAFGTTIGSVHYFSPEHARGGYTDAKSDLYSLGVVMYEMLTGRVPFDADTPVSIALKHMQEEPIKPIDINPNIPEALNEIILKALKKDPNQRYQSATEMLTDLRRAQKDPTGRFVLNNEYTNAPTQRMETIQTNNKEEKQEGKFKNFIKKHKTLTFIITLILLFFISLGGTMLYFDLTSPKEVILPNLVGKTQEEAESEAKKIKVEIVYGDEEYNSQYEVGQIIAQDPPYKEKYYIKEHSKIKLIVSKGIEKTKVPKVTGMTKDEAEEALKKANLKVEFVEETSQKIEEGITTKQEIDPDTEVNAGDTIKVYVSIGTGIKKVAVISVIGKDTESAKQTLTEAGLQVETEYGEDTTKDNGTVLKQSIVSGTTVDEGTKIILTINKLTEFKNATVTVNVKSIAKAAGYNVEKKEEKITINDAKNVTGNITGNATKNTTTTTTKTIDPDKIKVTVKFGPEGTEETAYDRTISADTGNITANVSGKGTINIKVYINDVLEKGPISINLNEKDKLTVE